MNENYIEYRCVLTKYIYILTYLMLPHGSLFIKHINDLCILLYNII